MTKIFQIIPNWQIIEYLMKFFETSMDISNADVNEKLICAISCEIFDMWSVIHNELLIKKMLSNWGIRNVCWVIMFPASLMIDPFHFLPIHFFLFAFIIHKVQTIKRTYTHFIFSIDYMLWCNNEKQHTK